MNLILFGKKLKAKKYIKKFWRKTSGNWWKSYLVLPNGKTKKLDF